MNDYTNYSDFVKPLTDNFYRINVARKNPRVEASRNAGPRRLTQWICPYFGGRLENNSQADTSMSFSYQYKTNQKKIRVLFSKSTSYNSNFLRKSKSFKTRKRTANRRFNGSFGNITLYSGEYSKLPKELKVR